MTFLVEIKSMQVVSTETTGLIGGPAGVQVGTDCVDISYFCFCRWIFV